jgi:hypothetical protein
VAHLVTAILHGKEGEWLNLHPLIIGMYIAFLTDVFVE